MYQRYPPLFRVMEVKHPKFVMLGESKPNLELNSTLHSTALDNGYTQ